MFYRKNILIFIVLAFIGSGCTHQQLLRQAQEDCKEQADMLIQPEYKKEMRPVPVIAGKKVVGSNTKCTAHTYDYCSGSKRKRGKCPPPTTTLRCTTEDIENNIYDYVTRPVVVDLNQTEREQYLAECLKNHPLLQQ